MEMSHTKSIGTSTWKGETPWLPETGHKQRLPGLLHHVSHVSLPWHLVGHWRRLNAGLVESLILYFNSVLLFLGCSVLQFCQLYYWKASGGVKFGSQCWHQTHPSLDPIQLPLIPCPHHHLLSPCSHPPTFPPLSLPSSSTNLPASAGPGRSIAMHGKALVFKAALQQDASLCTEQ